MKKEELKELKEMSFEKALEKLESIVSQMENGQLPLDDMMKAYEKGQVLSSVCSEKLKSIEKKVEILRQKANGDVSWENFDEKQEQTSAASAAVNVPVSAPVSEASEDDLLF
jgi:exodeoxyribonuclease VII small subunit